MDAHTSNRSLNRRLLPLYLAAGLQGFGLWIPIEKLFMSEIGFDAAAVGVMAAAYAMVVPLVEVPSGILADRWSRRGVLMAAGGSLVVSALVMGLSNDVPTYIAGAMILGGYFAMYSGTAESVVYDTVQEENGDSVAFERHIGRLRLVESTALVSSALAGGWLAELASPRLTYFLTVPVAALSVVPLARFREPRLHKTGPAGSLRSHLSVTYGTLARRGRLPQVVILAVLTAAVMQVVFEFGPLWLVELEAPAVVYGPYWAGLMAAIGIGGLLAGRLRLHRRATLALTVATMASAGLVLTTSRSLAVVTLAQVGLTVLIVIASIHVTRLLHDAVPSTVRSGVASGVGALSWIVFVPFSLLFGFVSRNHGVHMAGWIILGVILLIALVLGRVVLSAPPEPVADEFMPPADPDPVTAGAPS